MVAIFQVKAPTAYVIRPLATRFAARQTLNEGSGR
jgi:hypothetical protein